MRSYILLRNNRESGPYSLRELKTIGISSTDLIWVEGESASWTHPQEFDELKPLAEAGILIPLQSTSTPAQKHEDKSFSVTPRTTGGWTETKSSRETDYSQYLEDTHENFQWEPTKKRKILQDATSGFFGLGVLLIGVMMCAFVVQKLVDHFEFEPAVASAQAIEISRESLPVSTSANAAKTAAQSSMAPLVLHAKLSDPPLVATPAVTKQVEVKKKLIVDTPKLATAVANDGVVRTESPEVNEVPEAKAEESKEAPVEKKAPTLAVSANEYKVGMFGGISDLELAVTNPSSVAVNRATIEVEFLKPNGNVVKSETVSVEDISAGGTKKIQVPSSGRGVKVRYRVVSVDVN